RILTILVAKCGLALMLGIQAHAGQQGTLVAWGGQAIPFVKAGTRFKAIAAGQNHSLALTSHGTVVAWGNDEAWQCRVPGGLSKLCAIAAGGGDSLALKSDGTVAAWVDDNVGQSTVPSGFSSVIAVAAATSHSLALKSDGTVVASGKVGHWDGQGLADATVPDD